MTRIKKTTFVNALIVSAWLVVTLFLLGLFGIHSGWPAFLAMLFFIEGGKKIERLKSIFMGGTLGLITANVLSKGVVLLTPSLGDRLPAYLLAFAAIFLLIIMEDVSHTFFNSYTFCYFTVALISKEQHTAVWIITLLLGGSFVVGGIVGLMKIINNPTEKRPKCKLRKEA
jgi:hypothetical protein